MRRRTRRLLARLLGHVVPRSEAAVGPSTFTSIGKERSMTRNKIFRLVPTLALATVGFALTAGPATAEHPNDRAGMQGVGAVSAAAPAQPRIPDAFDRPVAASISASIHPDNRTSPRGPGAFSAPPLPTAVAAAADDFEWGDASVGAGAMLVALLLAGGFAVSVRHRGRAILP
jgi:hypothetical protein